MIGPCAICAAPKATELARSSVALKVSARTASHRRCSPLTSLSSVHGGAWSLPRGRKKRKRNFLISRSKERFCSRHVTDFCRVTGVGTRCDRGVATNPAQLVGEFTESSHRGNRGFVRDPSVLLKSKEICSLKAFCNTGLCALVFRARSRSRLGGVCMVRAICPLKESRSWRLRPSRTPNALAASLLSRR